MSLLAALSVLVASAGIALGILSAIAAISNED
jgi:hypothetical protein